MPGQNFTGEEGKSLSRCIQRTDDIAAEWRDACGISDVHEPANYFEMLINHELTQAGVLAGSGASLGGAAGAAGGSGESVVQIKPQRVAMKLRVRTLIPVLHFCFFCFVYLFNLILTLDCLSNYGMFIITYFFMLIFFLMLCWLIKFDSFCL